MLLGASVLVGFGSFLTWVATPVGDISGARGPGLWTFYAAVLGLAGAYVPWRRAAFVQGLVLVVAAIGLPVWQLARIIRLVGFGGWLPGPGVVLVVAGGILAALACRRLAVGTVAAPVPSRG